MILAFLANPIVRKVLLYGAIAVGAWYALRLYSNSVWNKGFDSGRKDAAAQIEKAKADEWAKREAQLAREQSDIELTRGQIDSEMTALTRTRQMTRTELQKILSAIQESRKEDNATVIAVRGSDLDATLRAVSADLAAH